MIFTKKIVLGAEERARLQKQATERQCSGSSSESDQQKLEDKSNAEPTLPPWSIKPPFRPPEQSTTINFNDKIDKTALAPKDPVGKCTNPAPQLAIASKCDDSPQKQSFKFDNGKVITVTETSSTEGNSAQGQSTTFQIHTHHEDKHGNIIPTPK